MERKQTNYQLYEQLDYLLKAKKPWSKEYVQLIKRLEVEPDYPLDDPLILRLINFAIDEIDMLAPHVTKRVNQIRHLLEVNFDSLDGLYYSSLAAHIYDLSNHLYGLQRPHLSFKELKQVKINSIARLLESLAAICANNAQIT